MKSPYTRVSLRTDTYDEDVIKYIALKENIDRKDAVKLIWNAGLQWADQRNERKI